MRPSTLVIFLLLGAKKHVYLDIRTVYRDLIVSFKSHSHQDDKAQIHIRETFNLNICIIQTIKLQNKNYKVTTIFVIINYKLYAMKFKWHECVNILVNLSLLLMWNNARDVENIKQIHKDFSMTIIVSNS